MLTKLFLIVCVALATACGGGGGAAPSDALPDAPDPNAAKEITAFGFQASVNSGLPMDVTATITGSSINATVPFGTDVTALKATFTSTGADVLVGGIIQTSGDTAVDYTNAVAFRVLAADHTTRDYTVIVVVAPSSAKELTAFSFDSSDNAALTADVTATITGTSINATVPFNTNVTDLKATFSTTGTSVTIGNAPQTSGVTSNNFTNPVTYRVTAADGSTKDYTVTVAIALSPSKDITAFSFLSVNNAVLNADVTATITGLNIRATVPTGTVVTGLKATFTTTGMTVTVAGAPQTSGSTANDFTTPKTYRVTAADGTTKDYTVTIIVAPSSTKDITAFSFLSANNAGLSADVPATITGTTITATVPFGTSVTALKATFTTTGASVKIGGTTQVSGVTANNFTSPKTYVVTAADNSTKSYTVTVTVAPSPAKDLTAFSFRTVNNSGLLADVTATITGTTITATVPLGTDRTALKATFTTTGANVKVGAVTQVSNVTANDFTNPVTYRVTAADATTQDYTVTVTESAPVLAAFGPAQSFIEVGQTAAPTIPTPLTVTLSTVSNVDTDVAISSNDTASLTIVGNKVTVPAGQLTAPVLVNGLAQSANVQLTATLGGSLSANVRVVGTNEQPTIASLSPATVSINANATLVLTLTLDFPVSTATTVALSLSPANAGAIPSTVVVPANQLSATFNYVDANLATSATITATLNGDTATSAITITPNTCSLTNVVISEIRSRGAGGAADEFIELFNPTDAPITLDNTWKLEARASDSASYSSRWVGTGKVIPAHGHFLIAGTGYTQQPAKDEALSTGISDANSIRLSQSAAVVDAVCYSFSPATTTPFSNASFSCEGTPVSNLPHDNSTTGNADVSVERKLGGAAGNCVDTGDNSSDFASITPALPQSSISAPTP